MITKIRKSINLDSINKEYINSILSKGVSNTINKLITKFKEENIQINFSKHFTAPEPTTSVALSSDNIEFLESVKDNSLAFTVNCLIATAKDLGMKI